MPDLPSNQSTVFTAGTGIQLTFTETEGAYWDIAIEGTAGGAPSNADYLVGTANGSLSAEIVVGTTPGGELGGTWASPTVDATHAGSSHAAAAALGAANTFTVGPQTIQTGAAGNKGLIVKGAASQSENLQEWQDSAGTKLVSVTSGGRLGVGNVTPGADLHIESSGGATFRMTRATFANRSQWSVDGTNLTIAQLDGGDILFKAGVDSEAFRATATGLTVADTKQLIFLGDTNLYRSAADTLKTDDTFVPTGLILPGAVSPAQTAEGSAVWDTDNDLLTVGDGVSRQTFLPVVDATSDPAAVASATPADGTEATTARKDHIHAHGTHTTDLHTNYRQESDDLQSITFSKAGTIAVGTGTTRWYNDTGRTLTLVSARASVGTAPTGAALIVDVNNNGTSVYTTQANRPTIAVSTNTDEGGAFDDSTILDGEYLTVDVDQVGSTVAGADLTVTIWWTS